MVGHILWWIHIGSDLFCSTDTLCGGYLLFRICKVVGHILWWIHFLRVPIHLFLFIFLHFFLLFITYRPLILFMFRRCYWLALYLAVPQSCPTTLRHPTSQEPSPRADPRTLSLGWSDKRSILKGILLRKVNKERVNQRSCLCNILS